MLISQHNYNKLVLLVLVLGSFTNCLNNYLWYRLLLLPSPLDSILEAMLTVSPNRQ